MIDALTVHAEPLLMALAVVLYVIDCGRLLRHSEFIAVGTAGKPLRLIAAGDGFRFRQRMAVFPALLAPGTAAIRLRAGDTKPPADEALATQVNTVAAQTTVAARISQLLLAEIFIGIPAAYYFAGFDVPLLIVFGLIYTQILGIIIWLWVQRASLGIHPGKALMISFECLVCIPYSINFHRKVFDETLHRGKWIPASAARGLLDENGQRKLSQQAQL